VASEESLSEATKVYYILFYEVVDEYVNRRASFREAHLEHAANAHHRGHLVMAGAFANPVDGAALVFQAGNPSVVEDFAREDP
jgi:uncharacterized protein YciI